MLTFDAATHTYRWRGVIVPSVTQILGQLTDLSMVPPDVLERKRQIGTWVHAAIELDLKNDLDYDSIGEDWRGYFDGWLKFKRESGFAVVDAEAKVYSEKYRYAGTLDLLGDLPKVGRALIDTKCTATMYPSVGPQTAAYAEAHGATKAKRYALQLKPTGTYELHACPDKGDFGVFLAAKTLYDWRKKHGNH
ncbi:MAG TPA: hypothetical protein VFQ99_06900 [Gallionella sp.]|nr:hypothetical protein [Gallionella sp.]